MKSWSKREEWFNDSLLKQESRECGRKGIRSQGINCSTNDPHVPSTVEQRRNPGEWASTRRTYDRRARGGCVAEVVERAVNYNSTARSRSSSRGLNLSQTRKNIYIVSTVSFRGYIHRGSAKNFVWSFIRHTGQNIKIIFIFCWTIFFFFLFYMQLNFF